MRKLLPLLLILACAPAGPPTTPNDREWSLLSADYQWIQTLRAAQKPVPANATRKQQIEIVLENQQKLAATYQAFIDKLTEYYERTSDPRAARVLAASDTTRYAAVTGQGVTRTAQISGGGVRSFRGLERKVISSTADLSLA